MQLPCEAAESPRGNAGTCWTALFFTICLSFGPNLIAGDVETAPVAGIRGSLVIAGGGNLPTEIFDEFLRLGGNSEARLVVVPTASIAADTGEIESRLEFWRQRRPRSFSVLHTRSREVADLPEFSKALLEATAVWFIGGDQSHLTRAYLGTLVEQRLHELLARGGVIGGTSAGAAIMSRTMINGTRDPLRIDPVLDTGFGFLPGCVVDQHFLKRNREGRLRNALLSRPGHFGVGIDEGTALVVSGRSLRVIGESCVKMYLAATPERPERIETLAAGGATDLLALSRAAVQRTRTGLPESPGRISPLREGTLVLAGDGRPPRDAVERFLEAAGGKDARIVVVSNGKSEQTNLELAFGQELRDAGAANVTHLNADDRNEWLNEDFVTALKDARGIWVAGDGALQLVDLLVDTPAEKLLADLLAQGGVLGGSSAGASILGQYLIPPASAQSPNLAAEGYERGIGLLSGIAIDRRLAAEPENRAAALSRLRPAHPQLIGVGLDRESAVIFRGATMQVLGDRNVTVIDRGVDASIAALESMSPGESYNLVERRRVESEVAAPGPVSAE